MITATKHRPGHESSFGSRDSIKARRSFETAQEAWDWVKQEKLADQMADRLEGFTYEVRDADTGKPVPDPSKVSPASKPEKKFKVIAPVEAWGVAIEELEGRKIRRRTKETPEGMKNPLVFSVKARTAEEAANKVRKHVSTMEPLPYLGKLDIQEESDSIMENNMEEKVFEVSFKNIEWDVDGYEETEQALKLPLSATVKVLAFDDKDAVQAALDRLTDDHGFLINQARTAWVHQSKQELPKLKADELKEMIVGIMRESLHEAEADRKVRDESGEEVNTDNIAFQPDKKTRPGTLKDVALELGIITDKEKPFTVPELDELEALGGKTAKRAIYAKAFLPPEKLKPKKVCK